MSLPGDIVGYAEPPKEQQNLGQLFSSILYEPGHPVSSCTIVVDWNTRAAQALQMQGQRCEIRLEVSCHPQVLSADPSKDQNMPDMRPGTAGLDKLIGEDAQIEKLEDREKWVLLTRELA